MPVFLEGKVTLDAADHDAVERGMATLFEDYARIAFLVNNAGITSDNLLLRMNREDWDRVLQTNLSGFSRLCRAVVPSMVRARYERIVNVGMYMKQ